MGIGTSSTQAASKSTGMKRERRKASWWRGKTLAEDVALATTQCKGEMLGVTEHLCSQMGSSSGGVVAGVCICTGSAGHRGTPQPRGALFTSDSKWRSVCAQALHRGREKPSSMTTMGRTGATNILQPRLMLSRAHQIKQTPYSKSSPKHG